MRRFSHLSFVFAIAFSSVSYCGLGRAWADTAEAQRYLGEAKDLIERRDFEGAASKIELAETELEGESGNDKATVAKGIADVKKQIEDAKAAGDKQKYKRDLDRVMSDLEGSIGNLVTWPGNVAALKELLGKPGVKAALGDELTKAQTKFQTFQKLHTKKAGEELTANLSEALKEFDATWNENKPIIAAGGQTENAVRYVTQAIDGLNRRMEGLPADNPQVIEAKKKIDAVSKELQQMNSAAGASSVVERFNRSVELYSSEWSGWEGETTGPNWEEFKKTVSESVSNFGAPKSVQAYQRLDLILNDITESAEYKEQASAPAVKAAFDKLQTQRNEAFGHIVKNATAVVDEAEKAPVDQKNAESYDRLLSGLTVALRGTSEGDALTGRVTKLKEKYEQETLGAQKAAEETTQKLTAEADKAWPAMVAKFGASDAFDPASAKSGAYYRIQDGANRMGWDYKPENGGFDFAMTTGGQPVAGNFAPAVKAAIEDIQKKTGKEIDDRGWDFVVQFEGRKGKLQQFREGDIKTTSGQDVATYRAAVPVDAPIVKVVALHIGPLAVAEGQGAVNADGAIQPLIGVGGGHSGGRGFLGGLFHLLIGLSAGLACLINAKFTPLTSIPQVSKVHSKVGDLGVALIGLVCGVFGVLWFLSALLHFSLLAMLVTLAIVAAGGYAALDILASVKIIKPDLQAKIRPFGTIIGLACVALVVVSLFW